LPTQPKPEEEEVVTLDIHDVFLGVVIEPEPEEEPDADHP
jgi:hypothetical protein